MLTRTTMAVLALLLHGAAPAAARQAQEPAPSASNARQAAPSSLRWYEAYNEGVAAVRASDWKRAEAMLLAARERHPEQGREVFYYGQTYRPFVPDYYLAQVYLNTGREVQALATLRRVSDAKLVDDASGLAAQFALARKAVVAAAEAARRDGNAAEVGRLVAAARDAGVNDKELAGLQAYVDDGGKSGANPPIPPTRPPVDVLAGNPIAQPEGNLGLPANIGQNRPTFDNAGADAGATTRQPTASAIARGNQPSTRARAIDRARAGSARADWTAGVRAFLTGDYPAAASLLASGEDPAAPRRVRLYLLCARVGEVLVGQGDAALLKAARDTFRSGNLSAAIGEEDGRYISPRILAQLEAR